VHAAGGEALPTPVGPHAPQYMRHATDKGWTGFVPQKTREVAEGFISSSGTLLPHLPRGSREDLKMVDRAAHERAAVHAPVYGDPGFIHCIGIRLVPRMRTHKIRCIRNHQDWLASLCRSPCIARCCVARLALLGVSVCRFICGSCPLPQAQASIAR
jgi:hypothetical protein